MIMIHFPQTLSNSFVTKSTHLGTLSLTKGTKRTESLFEDQELNCTWDRIIILHGENRRVIGIVVVIRDWRGGRGGHADPLAMLRRTRSIETI